MKIGVISDTHGIKSGWDKAFNDLFKDVDLILHGGDIFNIGPKNPLPADGSFCPKCLLEEFNSNVKVPMFFAEGNCDALVDKMFLKPWSIEHSVMIFAEGWKIRMLHGWEYLSAGKFNEEAFVESEGMPYGVNILIYGHTHITSLRKIAGVHILNPGSASIPLGGEKFPTAAVVELEKDKGRITIYNLETLEPYKQMEVEK